MINKPPVAESSTWQVMNRQAANSGMFIVRQPEHTVTVLISRAPT